MFQGWGWAICGATLPAAACPVHAKHPDMLQRAGARAGAAGWLVIALLELSAPALASSSALGAAVLRHRGTRRRARMRAAGIAWLSILLLYCPLFCGWSHAGRAGASPREQRRAIAQARVRKRVHYSSHARARMHVANATPLHLMV